MLNNRDLFYGFESDAAKKSVLVNTVLRSFIKGVETNLNLVTSTPKAERNPKMRMEISFSKHFEEAAKHEIHQHKHLHITMDYDSGYISNHQESNSSVENISDSTTMCQVTKPIYLSEDALLEKPEINLRNLDISAEIDKEDYEETRKLFNSPGTIIYSSVESKRSVYSGFENESESDMSIEIPEVEPLIIENKQLCNILDCTENGLSPVQDKVDRNITSEFKNSDSVTVNTIIQNESIFGQLQTCEIKTCSLNSSTQNNPMLTETCEELQTCSFNSSIQNNSTFTEHTEHENNHTPGATNDTDNNTFSGKIITNITTVLKEKKRLTLVFSKADKENVYKVKRKYPSMTPEKKIDPVNPNLSPDIFDDEEPTPSVPSAKPLVQRLSLNCKVDEKYIIKKDQRLLKRVQMGLNGVLPPPSMTNVQMSASDILEKLKVNEQYFWDNDCIKTTEELKNTSLNTSSESNANEGSKSLLSNVNSSCEFKYKDWPHILEYRYHGLHHNRSKLSEEFEDLCDKYAKRFVGAETQSTCSVFETNFPSPSKRKAVKQRWSVKSPGRRLSHLARRRITFSSANLQASTSTLAGSRARQILVDSKKMDLLNRRKSPRKTPRKTPKKTPSKSPRVKTRTPSSSAKKKLAMRFRKLTGEFEKPAPTTSSENLVLSSKRALFNSPNKKLKDQNAVPSTSVSSKRALFQSPDHSKNSILFLPSKSGLTVSENELVKPQLRRALFMSPSKSSPVKNKHSPFKNSPLKKLGLGFEKKRKRSECDETQKMKFPRSMSVDIRPTESEFNTKGLTRTRSDMNISLNKSCSHNELSEVHKKKLQWAVYEALKSQNITPAHVQFKIFASILARVTRRFLPNLAGNAPRPEGGTSERMLRIARHHVYAVVKGKSMDEIIGDFLRNKAKNQKPQGYVGIEEFNNAKNKVSSTNKENVLQDRGNTIESLEKRKLEQLGKPKNSENKIDRIRKVINFGDDNR